MGLVLAAVGSVALAGVHRPWEAFAAAATVGLGVSIVWPAQDALLAELVGPEKRSSVFSVRHLTLNAGLGAGALLAAVVVDVHHPGTFSALYVIDGLTFAVFAPLLLAVVPRRGSRPARVAGEPGSGGYREVLADRAMLGVLALSALVITISYGQFHSAFPAWATRPGAITPRALSVAFAANTLTVVVVQLPVLRVLRGRRRTNCVAIACAGFAATWLVTLAAGSLGGGITAALAFAAAMVLFGVSEAALTPDPAGPRQRPGERRVARPLQRRVDAGVDDRVPRRASARRDRVVQSVGRRLVRGARRARGVGRGGRCRTREAATGDGQHCG